MTLIAFKRRPLTPLTVLAMAAVAACSSVAAANEDSAKDEASWSGSFGAGAAFQPTYFGSPNQRTTAVPIFSLAYHHPVIGTIALDERGLSWTFLDSNNVRAGLLAGFDAGRREKDDSFNSGDDRLRGMGDLKSTAEVGALLGYGPVNLIAHTAVGDQGHRGFIADLEIGHSFPLTEQLGMSVGISTRWADQKYMQANFGVTPLQAAASRFSAFTAQEGFVYGSVQVGLEYRFSAAWYAVLGVTRQKLIEEAKASPLAEEPSSVSAFIGITRHFD